MGRRYATQLIGNKEKALIHVAKSQLGMTEDEYRALLGSVGCTSSVELTLAKFDQVMRRLEAAGFEPRSAKRSTKSSRHRSAPEGKRPLLGKIEAILADCGLPRAYADGVADRMFGVQSVRWCSAEQLHKVTAALAIYQKRKARKQQTEARNG